VSAASYGIPLALLASAAYNVGLIVEKRALGRMPTLDLRHVLHVLISLLTSRAWLCGFGLMLAGLGCQAVVLTLEPVSVVQPVLASGVVLVPLLSRLVLRERLRGGEIWCVAVIAASVVLLALSAIGTSSGVGHHASPGWMAAVMVASVTVGLALAASLLRGRTRKHGAPVTVVGYGVGTGLIYGVAALSIKALSGLLAGHRTAAGIVVGVISSPYLYVLAGSLVVGMLAFQAALQACRASIIVPVSVVTGSAYFVIAATWLFHEHLPASPARLGLRAAGIALAALGLIALARHPQEDTPGQPAGAPDHAGQGRLAEMRRR
jgi:drug/metabolite transporter (DMT)-like permease